MHSSSSWFRFERLQWAFPVAVTLHSLEEAIWLPPWAARHTAELPWQVTAAHFRLAVTLLTLAAYVVTWLSVQSGRQSGWTYVFIAYIFAMFLNIWVPHVPASILFRGYTPGVVTAVVINLPVTVLLLGSVFRERIISRWGIAIAVFGLPLGMAAGVAVLFAVRLH